MQPLRVYIYTWWHNNTLTHTLTPHEAVVHKFMIEMLSLFGLLLVDTMWSSSHTKAGALQQVEHTCACDIFTVKLQSKVLPIEEHQTPDQTQKEKAHAGKYIIILQWTPSHAANFSKTPMWMFTSGGRPGRWKQSVQVASSPFSLCNCWWRFALHRTCRFLAFCEQINYYKMISKDFLEHN